MTNIGQNLPTSPVFYSALFFHPFYEVWKPVVGYDGFYEVSTYGRVRTVGRTLLLSSRYGSSRKHPIKTKIKVSRVGKNGYATIALVLANITHNTYLHRIIAEAFIPNPNQYSCVNHINGIKTDNRISNLEWCSYSQNNLHALNNLLRRTRKFMSLEIIEAVDSLNASGFTNKCISVKLGLSITTVQGITSGNTYRRLRKTTKTLKPI